MRPNAVEKAAINAAAAGFGPTSTRLLREAIEVRFPGALARARAERAKRAEQARFAGDPPLWAKNMIRRHCDPVTRLEWHRSASKYGTSGRCFNRDRIVITAGSRELDQKIVLVHEIAHALAPWDAKHGDEFYDVLLRVSKSEGLYRASLSAPHGQARGLRAAARRSRAA